jgi:hypothetical protein
VNNLLLLQIYRMHQNYNTDLYRFFDRAICHLLRMEPGYIDQSAGASSTEVLYYLGARTFSEAA